MCEETKLARRGTRYAENEDIAWPKKKKKNETKERKKDAAIIGDLESPAHDTISVQSYSRSPQESEPPRSPGVEVQHQQ